MKLQRKGEFLSTRVQYIPLGRIRPNPQQPRRSFDEEGLAELAASIRSCGILQPLTVRRAGEAVELGVTPDALLTDVEEALSALGELTGQSVQDDVTDRIFQRFCVGK